MARRTPINPDVLSDDLFDLGGSKKTIRVFPDLASMSPSMPLFTPGAMTPSSESRPVFFEIQAVVFAPKAKSSGLTAGLTISPRQAAGHCTQTARAEKQGKILSAKQSVSSRGFGLDTPLLFLCPQIIKLRLQKRNDRVALCHDLFFVTGFTQKNGFPSPNPPNQHSNALFNRQPFLQFKASTAPMQTTPHPW